MDLFTHTNGHGGRRLKPIRVLAVGGAAILFAAPMAAWASPDSKADLAVAITDSRDPVGLSDNLGPVVYTVTVTNTDADDAATGVVLTDVVVDKTGYKLMPTGLTPTQGAFIESATPSQGTCAIDTVTQAPAWPNGQRATCNLGTLAAGASATVAIEVTASLNSFVVPQPAGAMVDTATVDATTDDPNPLNDVATQATTVLA
ncbi:MAG TPA: hypothetical protein VM142_01760 [Acidimicrobiales bacterium]|nr:hypothetical protein [Acidimicrobiales bacterium]